MDRYTVWCGGAELNDYYLNYVEATDLAESYVRQGYDDVVIEKVGDGAERTVVVFNQNENVWLAVRETR